jgi:glucan biosynthesis protein
MVQHKLTNLDISSMYSIKVVCDHAKFKNKHMSLQLHHMYGLFFTLQRKNKLLEIAIASNIKYVHIQSRYEENIVHNFLSRERLLELCRYKQART